MKDILLIMTAGFVCMIFTISLVKKYPSRKKEQVIEQSTIENTIIDSLHDHIINQNRYILTLENKNEMLINNQ